MCLLFYIMGPNIGVVLNYQSQYLSPLTTWGCIEIITFFLVADLVPRKVQDAPSTQFSYQLQSWRYVYETVAFFGPEGNFAIYLDAC